MNSKACSSSRHRWIWSSPLRRQPPRLPDFRGPLPPGSAAGLSGRHRSPAHATVNNATLRNTRRVYGVQAHQQLLNHNWRTRWSAGSRAGALFKPAGTAFDDLIDQPELHRLERRQEFVALDRGGNDFERLAGVPYIDLVEPRPQGEDFARLDLDIGRLTLRPTRGLMDHDPRVGEREAFALGTGA